MIRERKEELTTQIAVADGTEQSYGTGNGLPRDLPLTRLLVTVEGRFRITAQTTAGTINPEAPTSIVRNIQLKGTKVSGGGSVTLVNCTGEELSQLTSFYEQYDALGVRRKETNVAGTVFPAAGAATAIGEYDFRVSYIVPIAPRFATHEDEIAGILDPSIFSSLELVVKWANPTDFFSGGTGITAAFTAFGATTGKPTAFVTRFSPLAANLPINQFHYTYISRQINMAANAAVAADQKFADINPGNKIRAIMFRQYQEVAGTPKLMSSARPGEATSTGLYRLRVKLNGAEKLRVRWTELREMNAQQSGYRSGFDGGYALIDWADRGFLEDIFDTRGFGASATRFELVGDWLGLGANDRIDILQIEQVKVEA